MLEGVFDEIKARGPIEEYRDIVPFFQQLFENVSKNRGGAQCYFKGSIVYDFKQANDVDCEIYVNNLIIFDAKKNVDLENIFLRVKSFLGFDDYDFELLQHQDDKTKLVEYKNNDLGSIYLYSSFDKKNNIKFNARFSSAEHKIDVVFLDHKYRINPIFDWISNLDAKRLFVDVNNNSLQLLFSEGFKNYHREESNHRFLPDIEELKTINKVEYLNPNAKYLLTRAKIFEMRGLVALNQFESLIDDLKRNRVDTFSELLALEYKVDVIDESQEILQERLEAVIQKIIKKYNLDRINLKDLHSFFEDLLQKDLTKVQIDSWHFTRITSVYNEINSAIRGLLKKTMTYSEALQNGPSMSRSNSITKTSTISSVTSVNSMSTINSEVSNKSNIKKRSNGKHKIDKQKEHNKKKPKLKYLSVVKPEARAAKSNNLYDVLSNDSDSEYETDVMLGMIALENKFLKNNKTHNPQKKQKTIRPRQHLIGRLCYKLGDRMSDSFKYLLNSAMIVALFFFLTISKDKADDPEFNVLKLFSNIVNNVARAITYFLMDFYGQDLGKLIRDRNNDPTRNDDSESGKKRAMMANFQFACILSNKPGFLQALLDRGADPNELCDRDSSTTLILVAMKLKMKECAKILINHDKFTFCSVNNLGLNIMQTMFLKKEYELLEFIKDSIINNPNHYDCLLALERSFFDKSIIDEDVKKSISLLDVDSSGQYQIKKTIKDKYEEELKNARKEDNHNKVADIENKLKEIEDSNNCAKILHEILLAKKELLTISLIEEEESQKKQSSVTPSLKVSSKSHAKLAMPKTVDTSTPALKISSKSFDSLLGPNINTVYKG